MATKKQRKELRQLARAISLSSGRQNKTEKGLSDTTKSFINKYRKSGGGIKEKGMKDTKKAIMEYRIEYAKTLSFGKNKKTSKKISETMRRLNKYIKSSNSKEKINFNDVKDFYSSIKSKEGFWKKLKDYGFSSDQVVDMVLEIKVGSLSKYLDIYESQNEGEEFDAEKFRKDIVKIRKGDYDWEKGEFKK